MMIRWLSYPAFGTKRESFFTGAKRIGIRNALVRLFLRTWIGVPEGKISRWNYIRAVVFPIQALKVWLSHDRDCYFDFDSATYHVHGWTFTREFLENADFEWTMHVLSNLELRKPEGWRPS